MINAFDELPEENAFDDLSEEEVAVAPVAVGTKSEQAAQNLYNLPGFNAALEATGTIAGNIAGMAGAGVVGLGDLAYQGVKAIPGVPGEPDWERPAAIIGGMQETISDAVAPAHKEGEQAVGGVIEVLDLAGRVIKWPIAEISLLPEHLKDRIINEPLGEVWAEGLEKKGVGPLGQTAARIAPDAVLAATGIRPSGAVKGARGIDVQPHPAGSTIKGFQNPTLPPAGAAAPPVTAAAAASAKEMSDVIKPAVKGNVKATVKAIDPNPELVEAFSALDIAPGPSMVSESQPFQQIVSGMKSDATSGLKARDVEVRAALQERAETLVRKYGDEDRSGLEADIRGEFNEVRTALEEQAGKAFKDINTQQRLATPVTEGELFPIIDYLNKRIEAMGGVSELSRMDRSLYELLYRKAKDKDGNTVDVLREPTYGRLDAKRKEIGAEIKSPSAFSQGSDAAAIEHAYGILAEAQQRAAKAGGFGDEYSAANKLVVTRKMLEAESVSALGREMARGIIASIEGSARGLSKGDVNKFKTMMEAVPQRYRQQVAMSVLERVMLSGAGRTMKPSLITLADELSKNATAKNLLFSYLPKGARVTYEHIVTASRGFFRSLEGDNNSGTANAMSVLKSIDDGSMAGKLTGVGGRAFGAEWLAGVFGLPPGTGVAIQATADVAKAAGNRAGIFKTRTQKADAFLSSPAIIQASKKYAAGKAKEAQAMLEGTPVYNAWLKTITPAEAEAIKQAGFFAWVTQEATSE